MKNEQQPSQPQASKINAPGAPTPDPDETLAEGVAGGEVASAPACLEVGDYEIVEELGRGGMGVVYKARQRRLNRLVALKMILNSSFAGEVQRSRFFREAELIAAVKHPNIVAIHEINLHDGQPYYSMDFIEGTSLKELILRGPIAWPEAVRFTKTMAEAMQVAHEQGVIHRDLKPQNVMIDRLRRPHITDFGLARNVNSEPGLTLSGSVLGTPHYMSPEQSGGNQDAVTATSDIYALGVILYEMLTSVTPIRGENLTEILESVRHKVPVAPRRLNPRIPKDLNTVCMKCLEKDPTQRYPTAAQLAEELDRVLRDVPIKAQPVGPFGHGWRWCRRHRVLAAGGLVALLAVWGAAFYLWDNSRTKTTYAVALADRWSVPVAGVSLDGGSRRHWVVGYQIESSHGKVRRIERVNSAGELQDNDQNFGAAEEEIVYRENGQVDEIDMSDHNHHVVVEKVFSERQPGESAQTVGFQRKYNDQPLSLEASLTDSSFFKRKTDITAQRLVYDDQGRTERIFYLDNYRNPTADDSGVWGKRFIYNEAGFPQEVENLDQDGKALPDRLGRVHTRYLYDKWGNVTKEDYWNAEDDLVLGDQGFARAVFKYDEEGRVVEKAYFNTAEQPVLNRDGIARDTAVYDEHGNLVDEAFFGVNNQPVLNAAGDHREIAKFDAHGNLIETAFFGTDGRPILRKDGVARIDSKYDERGNQIDQAYFGLSGRPILDRLGVARYSARYDEEGNRTEVACFGLDDQPVLNHLGYAVVSSRYDQRTNLVEQSYFGVHHEPVLNRDGYALFRAQYNDRGNRTEAAYFGTDGQPVLNKDGVARFTSQYDDRGNITEVDDFGADGRPILNKDGAARFVSKYDDRGNLIELACFDTNDQPVLNKNGYALLKAQYDDSGNLVEEAFFGVDGRPILNKEGLARFTCIYNGHGNQLEADFFGVDGHPVEVRGAARVTFQYDARGHCIKTTHYNKAGQMLKPSI